MTNMVPILFQPIHVIIISSYYTNLQFLTRTTFCTKVQYHENLTHNSYVHWLFWYIRGIIRMPKKENKLMHKHSLLLIV